LKIPIRRDRHGLEGAAEPVPQKKARLRKARRLLIVPFKTKILQYNIFIEVTVYPGQNPKKNIATHDNQMNTGLPEIRNSGVDDWYGNIIFIIVLT